MSSLYIVIFAFAVIALFVIWVIFMRKNVKNAKKKCDKLSDEIVELQNQQYHDLVELLALTKFNGEIQLEYTNFEHSSAVVKDKQLRVFSTWVFRVVEESPKRISNKVQSLQLRIMENINQLKTLKSRFNANACYVNEKISSLPSSLVLRGVLKVDTFMPEGIRVIKSSNKNLDKLKRS